MVEGLNIDHPRGAPLVVSWHHEASPDTVAWASLLFRARLPWNCPQQPVKLAA